MGALNRPPPIIAIRRRRESPWLLMQRFEAAVVAMRAIRVKGAKVHEEVVRAYARAAVEAAERARKEDFQRRAQLNNKPTAPTAEGARS